MTAVLDAVEFSRLLADRTRLAVIGLIALEPRMAGDVANLLDVPDREVVKAMARLAKSGLIVGDGGVYRLDLDALRSFAETLTPAVPADPEMFRNLTDDEATVAARYFRGRRLDEIPAALGKRRAVLRRIVQEFEPGRRYSEAQVNLMLGMFHPDHASLRRYLVDDGLLDRDPSQGTYWRIGGPVEA